MKMLTAQSTETRIAREILSVLPEESVVRVCSDDRDSIRFSVTSGLLRLRSVVLNRESLRRLETDPARAIKIEYLQRDLFRSAIHRREYRYPRLSRIFKKTPKAARLRAASLAVAAIR